MLNQSQPPPSCPNIERVTCTKVHGITLNDRLSATELVNNLLTKCSSLLYEMRILRSQAIPTASLHDVFRTTILAQITYCLLAWSGLCSASDSAKLDSFLNSCKCLSYCDNSVPTISDIISNADDLLFQAVLKNNYYVLYHYYPDNPHTIYNLRQRPHNTQVLITKTTFHCDHDYIVRTLYKNSY